MPATKTQTELRHHPRLRTHLKAEVTVAEQSLEVVITNLSKSGLQLECPQALITALSPAIKNLDVRNPTTLAVNFQVPKKGKKDAEITLLCTVVHTRRESQNKHILGCQFDLDDNEGEKHLRYYLSHAPASWSNR